MTTKVVTTRHIPPIQVHCDKKHRKGHCRKNHAHGCNGGCKDLCLEQKICPACHKKTLNENGFCMFCGRKTVFLQPGNRRHQKIMTDNLCPECGGALNERGHCEPCNVNFTFLWKNMGWNPESKEYKRHKNGQDESHGNPLCTCHNGYPEINIGDRAYT